MARSIQQSLIQDQTCLTWSFWSLEDLARSHLKRIGIDQRDWIRICRIRRTWVGIRCSPPGSTRHRCSTSHPGKPCRKWKRMWSLNCRESIVYSIICTCIYIYTYYYIYSSTYIITLYLYIYIHMQCSISKIGIHIIYAMTCVEWIAKFHNMVK